MQLQIHQRAGYGMEHEPESLALQHPKDYLESNSQKNGLDAAAVSQSPPLQYFGSGQTPTYRSDFNSFTLLVCSQANSERPKCPYAAVGR